MTASRKEYFTDLLNDCDEVLNNLEGYDHKCFEGHGKAMIIAALIISDSLNGLRKGLLKRLGEY